VSSDISPRDGYLKTPTTTDAATSFFDLWLSIKVAKLGKHVLFIFSERHREWGKVIDELRDVVYSHYVAPEITAKRLAELGAPKTAKLIREHLPTTKNARSGDLGEVLAAEFAERKLGFSVPVRRLRWKDGRNMALRGDDIVAIARDPGGRLRFLKGESKSRARLTSTVVNEAAGVLDRNRGRPTSHSVLFAADHLRDLGEDNLAKDLEEAVLGSFHACPVEHLLFTVSGNNPNATLSNHLSKCTNPRRRHVVGVYILNHGKFIERLFSEL